MGADGVYLRHECWEGHHDDADASLEEDEERAETSGSGETDARNTKSLMSNYAPDNALDGYIKKGII